MKKIISFLFFILFFLSSLGVNGKTPDLYSFYQHDKFVIDGFIDDWGEMAIYNDLTGIISNISNDQEYLYIKIRITNFGTVNRLLMGGFTVWINDEGKPRRKKGINFPIKKEVSENFQKQEKMMRGLSKDQIQRLRKKNIADFNIKFATGTATINVLNNDLEILQYRPICKNEKGLSATLRLADFDLLIYEARIPLDMVFENKEDFLQSKQKAFSLGYEFGKYVIKEMQAVGMRAPTHSMDGSYLRRNRYKTAGYGTFPAIDTWYKRVYLSIE